MPLTPDELKLRARACRSLVSGVTDGEVVAALTRAADWFARQADAAGGPPIAPPQAPVVPFATGAEPARPSADRAAERIHLSMTAGLRKQGETKFDAQIADLSTVGFRVESHYAMPAGTQVFLTLPGLVAIPARVVWSRDNSLGCRFETPIHPAVFERVVAAARRG